MRTKLAPALALVAVLVAAAWLARGPVREGGVATASPEHAPPGERDEVVLRDVGPAPAAAVDGREELAPRADPAARDEPEATATPDTPAGPGGAPCVLHGWLRKETGDALGGHGFDVRVWDRGGSRRKVDVSTEGAYSMEALAPGAYWVVGRGRGWKGREEEIEVRAGVESIELDLVLSPLAMIRVDAYTDDGRALADALDEEGLPDQLQAAATVLPIEGLELAPSQSVGEFHLRPREAEAWVVGHVELPHPQAVHVSLLLRDVLLADRPVAAGADEAVFRVPLDEVRRRVTLVRLRVVDAQSGLPVDTMLVSIDDRSVWMLREEDRSTLEVLYPIGTVSVRVVALGYEERVESFELVEGPENDLGEIALEPAFVVRGRVVPPPGVDVDLSRASVISDRLPEPGEPQESDNVFFGRACAADGSFEITLGGGRHRLWCDLYQDGGQLSTGNHVVDTREGPVKDLELELLRERRLLLRPTPSFPPSTRLVVEDAGGIGIVDFLLEGQRPHPLDLPPGIYKVRLSEEDGPWSQTLDVTLGRRDAELSVGP